MLRGAVAADPKRAEAHNALGVGLGHLGLAPEARREFERALQLRPDYASARFNLAEALQKSGHLDQAIENFRQVIAAYPGDDTAHYGLQKALEAQSRQATARNDWKAAAAAYAELVELAPDDASLRNDYGEALLHLNQAAQAREQFEKALALDPANDVARRNRDSLDHK
jgi:tetratricopeptide (TPR) repeat protein